MINKRDVICMKIPYPDIGSGLALKPHLYICKNVCDNSYEYIKCQTLKPAMLIHSPTRHFVDEPADISRNPFQRTTRIDCDKIFTTTSVQYDDRLKTSLRPDICQELYDSVLMELSADGYVKVAIDEDKLTHINSLITKV